MHELLKNYAITGLTYINTNQLVEALKQADNSYFIDDLNFLTLPSNMDCLCGCFPGTDFTRNFSYLRLINKNWQTSYPVNVEMRSLDRIFISCRDLNVLERYLAFYYENRVFKRVSLNVPVTFADAGQSAEEALPKLLAKYSDYYRLSSQMFDYRFQDFRSLSVDEEDPLYQIVSTLQDIFDNAPVYDDWFVLKKFGKPVLAYGCSPYYDPGRIGIKVFSFDNSFYTYENELIATEDVLYLWKYLANKFTSDGYVVKGIAIDDGFDNDEMYERMGMTKYRCFVGLITDN